MGGGARVACGIERRGKGEGEGHASSAKKTGVEDGGIEEGWQCGERGEGRGE